MIEIQPNPWMALPFVILLTAIALGPLWFAKWWGRYFSSVAFGLAVVAVVYYWAGLGARDRVFQTAIEYVSFLCLIGSLFVISGGIHINVKGEATPTVNILFLFIGALISNVLGTTGASMLLVRPWLRMNRYRLTGHHIVFFIFIVSNVGGALTPVGDPPLFLGYLKGVPFWWVAVRGWSVWLVAVGLLLVTFFVVDTLNFKRAPRRIREYETAHEEWRFQGLTNFVFLAVVLGAVFIHHPAFLREFLMLSAAGGSYLTTRKPVHEANAFSFQPIREVAILFAGIFATMMPALDWLQANAIRLGQPGPGLFFWGSGVLSSVLDNAPTYLSFLSVAFGAAVSPDALNAVVAYVQVHGADLGALTSDTPGADLIRHAVAALNVYTPDALLKHTVTREQAQMALVLAHPLHWQCLKAVSFGSVFFGANTYIGNGPNFMVKAIADHQKAHTPTFLGYVFKFTIPFMLPMLLVVWWFFFRG
jgi:Na+/H+ antiporter NhaD/arsenite permease-like protein